MRKVLSYTWIVIIMTNMMLYGIVYGEIIGTVTIPGTGDMYAGSSTEDIVWEISGSTGDCEAEIWLSVDGGVSYTEFIGTCTHTADGGRYRWEIPGTNTGEGRIKIRGTDTVTDEMYEIESGVFMIDSEVPKIGTIAVDGITLSGKALKSRWKNEREFKISWAGEDNLSGVKGAWMKMYSTPKSPTDGTFTQGGTFTVVLPEIVENSIAYAHIYIWLEDNVGNKDHNNRAHVILQYEGIVPANPGVCNAWVDDTKAEEIEDNKWYGTDNKRVYFEWEGAHDEIINPSQSGVCGYSVYWGTLSVGEPGTDTYQTETCYYVPEVVGSVGTYYLRIRTRDIAGNWSEPTTLFVFKYDGSEPKNPIECNAWVDATKTIAIGNNECQNKYTKGYFEWADADDNGSGVCGYSVYWGTLSVGEPGTDTYQAETCYYTSEVVGSETIYYLRIRTRDIVGNWSDAKTLFVFKYDNKPPGKPTSIAVDGVTLSGQILKSRWKNEREFKISWAGEDNLSGIKGAWMKMYSTPKSPTDGTFTQGGTFTVVLPEIVEDSIAYAHMYIWLEDNVGNKDHNNRVHIILQYEGIAPANAGVCNAWADDTKAEEIEDNKWYGTDNKRVYFEWEGAHDAVRNPGQSGVCGYSVYWGTLSTGEPGTETYQDETWYYTPEVVGSVGTYYLRIRTRDIAGNWSDVKTLFVFKYDAEAPVIEFDNIDITGNTVTCTGSIKGRGSLVKMIRYEIDNSNKWIDVGTYTANTSTPCFTFTTTLEEGTHSIKVEAKDEVGNCGVVEYIISIEDTTAPGKIEEIRVVDVRGRSITLEWVTTGDNGYEGIANGYDIRYAEFEITEEVWDKCIQCEGEPEPGEPGSTDTYTVYGLEPLKIYWFGIKVIDEAGNESEVSVVVSCKTTGVIVYPNPADRVDEVTFEGSGVQYSKIRIYTISGELVRELHEREGRIKIKWDLRNEQGNRVSSGIYVYHVINEIGENRGKICVIR